MNTIKIDIVSAEKAIFSGTATMVVATGILGEIGILPDHTPLLTTLKPGQVRVTKPDGHEEIFWISGGLLEIQPFRVTVLADLAERAADLDEMVALETKKRAEQTIKNHKSDFDVSQAQVVLSEVASQLQVISRIRRGK